jgi:hypothetical protein
VAIQVIKQGEHEELLVEQVCTLGGRLGTPGGMHRSAML